MQSRHAIKIECMEENVINGKKKYQNPWNKTKNEIVSKVNNIIEFSNESCACNVVLYLFFSSRLYFNWHMILFCSRTQLLQSFSLRGWLASSLLKDTVLPDPVTLNRKSRSGFPVYLGESVCADCAPFDSFGSWKDRDEIKSKHTGRFSFIRAPVDSKLYDDCSWILARSLAYSHCQ